MITGCAFGGTNTIVGHPFDTIKTKMQVQAGYKESYINSIKKVYAEGGIRAFYKGWVPPFFGSVIFRSLQFTAYEVSYANMDNDTLKKKIPLSGGIEWRVLLGGIAAGSTRAVLECPFEYAKVK